jgi:hypothetical protein
MVRCRLVLVGLMMIASVALNGCFSRKLAVMDLNDTLNAIADELCGVPLKDHPPQPGNQQPEGKFATVTLVTATGVTVGVDGAGVGIPISASGNVEDSTTIAADLIPRCDGDASARLTRRKERAVYEYDTGTGKLTPLNAEAKRRLTPK